MTKIELEREDTFTWGTVVARVDRRLSKKGNIYHVVTIVGNSYVRFQQVGQFSPRELASLAFVLLRVRFYCWRNRIKR